MNSMMFFSLCFLLPAAAEPWTLGFAQEPADTQFAHTRNAVLNCVVAGNPKPSVTWRLARTKIVVTNITGLRYVMANGSLVFPPFLPDKLDTSVHQADYQCLAENKLGSLISRAAKLRAGKFHSVTANLVRKSVTADIIHISQGRN